MPIMKNNDLRFNSLNAQDFKNSISNLSSSFSIETINKSVTRTKLSQQDIWVEITANSVVLPGGVYTCSIKLWNLEVNSIDSIVIVYLAPNSKNISLNLDDNLYTSLDETSIKISGPPVEELLRDIHSSQEPFPDKLDSLVWLIPELPVTQSANDTVRISFTLRVDILISGSIKLNNDFLIFIIEKEKETLILSDNKITGILLVPEIQIEKTANKDTVKLGESVDFTITIRNNGGKDADSILIFDEIPQGLKFIGFIMPDEAATRSRGAEADSQNLTWLIDKLPKRNNSESMKEVGFSARVREDFKIETLISEITNVSQFKRGGKETGSSSKKLYIRSDPDLIGQITNIIIPKKWSYEDSIKIESVVINQGGADVTENFMVRLYFVDTERAPTNEIIIWEGIVSASIDSPLTAVKGSQILPTQYVRLQRGGTYKFCVSVDLNNSIREKNEANNTTCRTEEIRIPAQFYLSRNRFKPTQPDETSLNIKGQIPYDGRIEIKIFDEAGEFVKTLLNDFRQEGFYDLLATWDGRDESGNLVGSGVYVFSIEGHKFHETLKVVVIR